MQNTVEELVVRNLVGSGRYTPAQARDRVMAPAVEKHLVIALSRSFGDGLARVALSDVERRTIDCLVGSNHYTRKQAVEKVLSRRAGRPGVMPMTRQAARIGSRTIELSDVDEIVVKNLVASGHYTRENAVEKVRARRNN